MKKKINNVWNRKLWKNLLIILGIMSILLAGCGSANSKSDENASSTETAEVSDSAVGMEDAAADVAQSGSDSASKEETSPDTQTVETQDTSRKLIKNASMSVETKAFDKLVSTLNQKVTDLGGYLESSDVQGNSYNSNSNRYATLVARIPVDKLSDFLDTVSKESNVISKNETVQDITLQYVDTESHKKSLLVEQERLLALLEKAEKLEDIIAIESRLSEVRYQIESYESQLRTYDNQVDYSTVTIQISEVERETPVKEQTVFERIKTGFVDNLHNIGVGLKDLFVWVIVNIPYFAILAVIVVIIIFSIRKTAKRKEKKVQNEIQQASEKENKKD